MLSVTVVGLRYRVISKYFFCKGSLLRCLEVPTGSWSVCITLDRLSQTCVLYEKVSKSSSVLCRRLFVASSSADGRRQLNVIVKPM